MTRTRVWHLIFVSGIALAASCQVQRTSIPIGDAASRALETGSLTGKSAKPFHVRLEISEPENPQSPYQGTIEEWWSSPTSWRRTVTAKNMQQIIVYLDGKKTEADTGDYFPLWLRNFVTAAFDPIPDAAAWTASGITIDQMTMPDGSKSFACARSKSQIGVGDQATDAFSNLCFDSEGHLQFYGSPRYSMGFEEYAPFGKVQVPRKLVANPEPGTTLAGSITVLEELKTEGALFAPLATNDTIFTSIAIKSAQMQNLSANNGPIAWPPVRSGHTQGRLAVYVSVDRTGKVREAWPLNSDNPGLQDAARQQVSTWTMKAAVDSAGNRIQVDGGLGFAFATRIGDPLPQLSNADVRALAITVVEPVWSAADLHPGDMFEARISVDEHGKLAGVAFTKTPAAARGAVMAALNQWTLHPLVRDGRTQYFQGVVQFIVPK